MGGGSRGKFRGVFTETKSLFFNTALLESVKNGSGDGLSFFIPPRENTRLGTNAGIKTNSSLPRQAPPLCRNEITGNQSCRAEALENGNEGWGKGEAAIKIFINYYSTRQIGIFQPISRGVHL